MEEDIKVLEEMCKQIIEEDDVDLFETSSPMEIAIKIKHLIDRNKELEKENIIIKTAKEEVEELLENSIPISKIQEKIEDLKRYIYTGENAPQDFLQYRVKAKIQILEELLEE